MNFQNINDDADRENETNFYFQSNDSFNSFMKIVNFRDSMCVMQLNAQRVADIEKFLEPVVYIESLAIKPDLIVLEETWIVDGTGGMYQIEGYEGVHCCRQSSSAGIAIYYLQKYAVEVQQTSSAEVSYIDLKVFDSNRPSDFLVLTALYMPRRGDIGKLEFVLSELLSRWSFTDHLVVGDLNVNAQGACSATRRLFSVLDSYGYHVANTTTTRPVSGSQIDYVITNFYGSVNVTVESGVSDHNSIFTFMKRKLSAGDSGKRTMTMRSIYYNGVMRMFAQTLMVYDWESMDSDELLEFLISTLLQAIECSTRLRVCKVKRSYTRECIDPELLRLSKRKHRLLRKLRRRPSDRILEAKVSDVTRRVEALKRAGTDKYFQAAFGENVSCRQKWQNLNEFLGRKKRENVRVLRREDGTIESDPMRIVEMFSDYFGSALTNTQADIREATRALSPNDIEDSMFFAPVTVDEVG